MSLEVFFCWIEKHPGLASWIQTIGSIIAIAVAVWIASVPERRHRKEQLDKENVMKLAIVNIALGAEAAINALRDEVSEVDYSEGLFPDSLLMASEASMVTLSSVDLTSFPNLNMLVPFMKIKAQMELAIAVCKTLKLNQLSDADKFLEERKLDSAANNISASLSALKKASSLLSRRRKLRPGIGFKLTMRKRLKVNLWLAVAGLGIAILAPLLANNFLVYWKPLLESQGDWLERSGAITTVFSLLVITLMDECLGNINIKDSSPRLRKFALYQNLRAWAHCLKNIAFISSILGTMIWGYGSLIYSWISCSPWLGVLFPCETA